LADGLLVFYRIDHSLVILVTLEYNKWPTQEHEGVVDLVVVVVIVDEVVEVLVVVDVKTKRRSGMFLMLNLSTWSPCDAYLLGNLLRNSAVS
jgi:hypothetical protein